MRYAPYEQEAAAAATMSEAQRLEYFLTRIFETEEIWGLDDGCEWIIEERHGQQVMPVWPYQQFASEAATDHWRELNAQAEALEDFLEQTLGMLIDDDVMLEIMPTASKPGCLIAPQRVFEILTGMINAGEYTLDS